MNQEKNEKELEATIAIVRILRKPIEKRTFYDYELLADLLQHIKYFSECKLVGDELIRISKCIKIHETKEKEIVFDYKSYGNDFYVILMGQVSVQIPMKDMKLHQNVHYFEEVARLDAGSSFGELASVIGQRSARIVSLQHSYFLLIPSLEFDAILKRTDFKRLDLKVNFLRNTPYFKNCSVNRLYLIQYYLCETQCLRGQIICNFGDIVNHVYLIINGEFEMKKIISKRIDIREKRNKEIGEAIKMKKGAKDLGRILKIKQTGNRDLTHISKEISTFDDSTPKDQLMEVSVKTMGVGEFFGHDDLLNDRQRYTATFKCVSLTAMIYVITKKNFNKWIRNLSGPKTYFQHEIPTHEIRTNEYLKLCKKIKTTKLPRLKKKRNYYSSINLVKNLKPTISPKKHKRQKSLNFSNSSTELEISTNLHNNQKMNMPSCENKMQLIKEIDMALTKAETPKLTSFRPSQNLNQNLQLSLDDPRIIYNQIDEKTLEKNNSSKYSLNNIQIQKHNIPKLNKIDLIFNRNTKLNHNRLKQTTSMGFVNLNQIKNEEHLKMTPESPSLIINDEYQLKKNGEWGAENMEICKNMSKSEVNNLKGDNLSKLIEDLFFKKGEESSPEPRKINKYKENKHNNKNKNKGILDLGIYQNKKENKQSRYKQQILRKCPVTNIRNIPNIADMTNMGNMRKELESGEDPLPKIGSSCMKIGEMGKHIMGKSRIEGIVSSHKEGIMGGGFFLPSSSTSSPTNLLKIGKLGGHRLCRGTATSKTQNNSPNNLRTSSTLEFFN